VTSAGLILTDIRMHRADVQDIARLTIVSRRWLAAAGGLNPAEALSEADEGDARQENREKNTALEQEAGQPPSALAQAGSNTRRRNR
jgi:hypothetical protein